MDVFKALQKYIKSHPHIKSSKDSSTIAPLKNSKGNRSVILCIQLLFQYLFDVFRLNKYTYKDLYLEHVRILGKTSDYFPYCSII